MRANQNPLVASPPLFLGVGVIKAFIELHQFFSGNLPSFSGEYWVEIHCKDPRAQMMLEEAIRRELGKIQLFPERKSVRVCEGTIYGIKFKLTS